MHIQNQDHPGSCFSGVLGKEFLPHPHADKAVAKVRTDFGLQAAVPQVNSRVILGLYSRGVTSSCSTLSRVLTTMEQKRSGAKTLPKLFSTPAAVEAQA